MLHISKSVDYAVRLMVHLSTLKPGERECISTISRIRALPAPYVRQLIAPLVRAGLVDSHRGVGGGLCLALPTERISLLAIVEAVDGPIQLGICQDGEHGCALRRNCPVSGIWGRIGESLRTQLSTVVLAHLVAAQDHIDAHRLIRNSRLNNR